MKKILVASTLVVGLLGSAGALADEKTICTGATTAGAGAAPNAGTAGTHYMVTAISPKCSANVHLFGMDGTSGAWYAVGSASVKGKSTWKGHTNGGSVQMDQPCAIPGGCTTGEATAARDAAHTLAGGT